MNEDISPHRDEEEKKEKRYKIEPRKKRKSIKLFKNEIIVESDSGKSS